MPTVTATAIPTHTRRRRHRYDPRIPLIARSERVFAVALDGAVVAPPAARADADQEEEADDEPTDRHEEPHVREAALVLDVARAPQRALVTAERSARDPGL